MRGYADDVFAGSLWACGSPTAAKDSRAFGLEVEFVHPDGTTESYTSSFNTNLTGWQYLYDVFIPKKDYVKINVSCVYSYHGNMVLFDGLGFYQEDFAASYLYDGDGNVTSVQSNAKQKSKFEYNGSSDLTKLTDPKGNNFTYTYDSKHNVTKAVSAANVTYTYDYDDYGNPKTAKTVYDDTEDNTKDMSISTAMTTAHENNYVETITDALGNTVYYHYGNPDDGLLNVVTDAKGSPLCYSYDEAERLEQVVRDYFSGFSFGSAEVLYSYENDNLSKITHNGFDYTFTYDAFGNNTGVQVAGNQLVSRQYEPNNGNLASVQYGNGYTYLYTYDDLQRVTEVRLKDPSDQEYVLYRYEYDQDGNLSATYDIREDIGRETIVTRYFYDMSGRLVYARNNQDEDYRYTYDLNNNLVKVEQGNQFHTVDTEYTYDKDGRETGTKTPSKTFTTVYDALGRVASQSWNTATAFISSYTYQAGAGGAGSTSNQVSKVTAGGKDTSYEYDANGNITKITTVDGSITYAYDELNQLIREDNSTTGQTIGYVYDAGGNLLEKRIFAYLPDKTIDELKKITPSDSVNYTYDSTFKDKLVSYDGEAITYDAIGNPLSYRGMTFTWKKSRELNQIQKDGKVYTYRYNADGLRNRKYLEDGTVLYQLDGNLLIGEQKINNAGNMLYEMEFIYDSAGNILAMMYNGDEYCYVKNLQGDVVGILNSQGTEVVSYQYDSWGKLLEVNGDQTLGNLNPFRYRGYYYDAETGFYYVSSRYYDTEIGRWINADSQISSIGGNIKGYNLFAYCFNNPINMSDPSGGWPQWLKNVGNAIVSAAKAVVNFFSPNTHTISGQFQDGIFRGSGSVTGGYSDVMVRGQGDKKVLPSNKEPSVTAGAFAKLSIANASGKVGIGNSKASLSAKGVGDVLTASAQTG